MIKVPLRRRVYNYLLRNVLRAVCRIFGLSGIIHGMQITRQIWITQDNMYVGDCVIRLAAQDKGE